MITSHNPTLKLYPVIRYDQTTDVLLPKEKLNASSIIERTPVRGKKCQKHLGGIIGRFMALNGFPDGSNIGSTVLYNIGEKPTVILYTYINRHAGTVV